MKRFSHLLRQPEFHLFLFCLGLILLNWPFLAVFQGRPPELLFFYLMSIWAIAVILLFLIARACRSRSVSDHDQSQDDL